MRWSVTWALLTVAALGTVAPRSSAWADEPPADAPKDDAPKGDAPKDDPDATPGQPAEPPPADERTTEARRLFADGIAAVKRHRWGQALDAFERSLELRPHAVTLYNIGACERAMGRYTRARRDFRAALSRHDTTGELSDDLVDESKRFLDELSNYLAKVTMSVTPVDAIVTVDGAPLYELGDEAIGGLLPAGTGRTLPRGKATLVLDPGAHVILVTAKGYDDQVVNRTVVGTDNPRIDIQLRRKNAVLRVRANERGARVIVDDKFIGVAPLDVFRPAGKYDIRVARNGFEPYESSVSLTSGQELTFNANLVEDSPSVLETWWFWTIAGVVVTGAIVGTYFAVRSEPERPPIDGGGLGWRVPIE